MRRLALALITVLAVALGGCSDSGSNLGALDKPLRVAYQDQVTLPAQDLTIVFTALDEDSRCPVPATCAAAGQATMSIALSMPDSPIEPRTLTLGPAPGSKVAGYQGFTITLVKLVPYPSVGHQPLPSDYVATLVVSRS
jgi:hypothetical protein